MGRVALRRGRDETALIKLLIWQSYWDGEAGPSQRTLARTLHVSQPYVCKTMRKAVSVGFDELVRYGRPTLQELEQARGVTSRVRERAPALFAPAPTGASDEPEPQRSNPYYVMAHARTLEEWKQLLQRGERRVFSVPIPR